MTPLLPPQQSARAAEYLLGAADAARRIHAILDRASLECGCHDRLAGILNRFAGQETERSARRLLREARLQRERLVSLAGLLQEIEELQASEIDDTIATELAMLFDDVASSGLSGATAMRKLALLRDSGMRPW